MSRLIVCVLVTCLMILSFGFVASPCPGNQDRAASSRVRAGFAVYRAPSMAQDETSLEWRHNGKRWQQVPIPRPALIQRLNLPRRLPLVHPIRFATLVVLFVMMAVVWSSDEWQWSRLVRDDEAGADADGDTTSA